MSSKQPNTSYEQPSSTTPSDDLRDDNGEVKKPEQAPPNDSSEAEAAPTSPRADIDDRSRSSESSASQSASDVSEDVSSEESEDSHDACSWTIKFHESKEEDNNDPNDNVSKNPPRSDTPQFRPPSPFELEPEEEETHPPPDEMTHIELSRAETDAIIDRLLNSCDGDFGDEFDEFDPADIKFEVSREEREAGGKGSPIIDLTDDDDIEREPEIIEIDESDDDDEVEVICSRQDVTKVSVDRSVSQLEVVPPLDVKPETGAYKDVGKVPVDRCVSRQGAPSPVDVKPKLGVSTVKVEVVEEEEKPEEEIETDDYSEPEEEDVDPAEFEDDTIFLPPKAVKREKFDEDLAFIFGEPGPSTSQIVRPSTSRAALEAMLNWAPAEAERNIKSSVIRPGPDKRKSEPCRIKPPHVVIRPESEIKSEPMSSIDAMSTFPEMTDYRYAFAEVEQLLSEDNERNRLLFAHPVPPSSTRGMFKSNHN